MKAVNGTTSYLETYYEIVSVMESVLSIGEKSIVLDTLDDLGSGGLYELAEDLTDKFEQMHEGREWEDEWRECIEKFCEQEIYKS